MLRFLLLKLRLLRYQLNLKDRRVQRSRVEENDHPDHDHAIVKDVVPDQETEDVQDLVVIAEGDHDHEIGHEIVEEAAVEIKDRRLNEITIKKKRDLKIATPKK